MSLNPGSRLGAYEIVSFIGAGGMGEVYRARDTRLDRTVAIKILPGTLAADSQLRERFEREARSVASLTHPNICTLHDVGREGAVDFLVMEFLEGETLERRLEKGALPIDQAMRCAVEIADALARAHRAGIIHRDLKPANIMLTKSGAKLLDFGLAKTSAAPGPVAGLSMLPTTPPTLTTHGAILGTFQYMAPEQLEGGEADARTDIFSFGAVLYEMVTGKRAFVGKSQASLIGAILKDQPPSASALQPLSHPQLDHIIARCLEKNPDDRWQNASDVMHELTSLAGFSQRDRRPAKVIRETHWRHVGLTVAAVAVASLLSGIAVWLARPQAPRPVRRFAIVMTDSENFSAGAIGRQPIALSPDAKFLVYVANRQLHLRAMDQLDSSPLHGTNNATNPFFSPDSQWIGFFQEGQIKKMSVRGGPALALGESVNPFGASWGDRDVILFSKGPDGVWQVPAGGGPPSLLIAVDSKKGESAHSPQMLPGGEAVMFTVSTGGALSNRLSMPEHSEVVVQSPGLSDRKVVIRAGVQGRYLPTGHVLYVQQGTLLALPFDLRRHEAEGTPVPLLEGVAQGVSGGVRAGSAAFSPAQFTISDEGMLAYVPASTSSERVLVWVDRQGREAPIPVPPRANAYPRISPDGTRVALDVRDQDQDIHIWDLNRQTLTRVTFDPGADVGPAWTPDGHRIAFSTVGKGLFWRSADGTGAIESLTSESTNLHSAGSFSPTTKVLVFNESTPVGDYALSVVHLGDKPKVETLLQTAFNENNAAMSGDGRWLAYQSNESGRPEIYVRPFPDVQSGRWQISTGGGTRPAWASSSREIFYLAPNATMMAVPVDTRSGFKLGNPTKLFSGPYFEGLIGRTYDVSADGQRFLMIKSASQGLASAPRIVIVENWFEELKQRVPTK